MTELLSRAASTVIGCLTVLLAGTVSVQAQLTVTANFIGNSVTVHAHSASTNTPPVRVISGALTGINGPIGLAVDPFHNELFVANTGNDSITVYPLSGYGNIQPLRTLGGAATGLSSVEGIAVDPTNNELIVANNFDPGTVTVYSRTAFGNVPPIRTLSGPSTGLKFPLSVTVDTVHDELYVANNNGDTSVSSITVYSRTAKDDKPPLRTLGGAKTFVENPDAIALDLQHDEIVIADCNSYVSAFPRTAQGNVPPIRRIVGADVGLQCAVGVGIDFLHDELQIGSYFNNAVVTFARTASGDAQPLRVLTGASTGISGTAFLAVTFPPNAGTILGDGSMSMALAGVDFLPAGTGSGTLTLGSGTGSLAGLDGTAAAIKDLTFASLQVPAKAALADFLTFTGNPDLHFTLTKVDAGLYTSALCGAAPAAGQTCTPAGSPYNFVNTTASTSQVSFVVEGTVTNPYTGETSNFATTVTAVFGTDYQTVLAALAGTGSVTTAHTMSLVVSNPPTLDIDGSSPAATYDALTDGLLVIRYLFGLTGSTLVNGAVTPGAQRNDPASITSYLDGMRTALDVDGNGTPDALTDGLLILRYLFGLRGDSLIAGAVDAQATRKTAADIETYIQTLMP